MATGMSPSPLGRNGSMADINQTSEDSRGRSSSRVDAVAAWRSPWTVMTGAWLLFESVSGLLILLAPFSEFNQFNVLVHTIAGVVLLLPVAWYLVKHWLDRRGGNLSHYQLLGYVAVALLAVCVVSGLVLTWQGVAATRISYVWDVVHLASGIALAVFVVAHLLTVIVRRVNREESLIALRRARRVFYAGTVAGCGVLFALCGAWMALYEEPSFNNSFSDDYNWRYGEDRPFAPSLAQVDRGEWHHDFEKTLSGAVPAESRAAFMTAFHDESNDAATGLFARVHSAVEKAKIDDGTRKAIEVLLKQAATDIKSRGAIDARQLAGSQSCGTAGCHEQVYKEWLPSAHRYSSLDDMFQRVQTLMATETSPEHTRYCAGCHDPISLFSGAKTEGNITLSSLGADEGSSCIVCHSITRTDVHGNAAYEIRPPQRYVYETDESPFAKLVSDFLIRTYPKQHIESYSRPLYKTAEFCAACHKQYIDKQVNTDIGMVQGQNQYDSWKNSRWYRETSDGKIDHHKTVNCRECHLPLTDSTDPARGDVTDYNRTAGDGKHRHHGMIASNQYMPAFHKLEGADVHSKRVEQWLRGEVDIPEIADKWVDGPVVKMRIVGPETIAPGDEVSLQVVMVNNKTGHDFPTGPLDMIESWVELKVTDSTGGVLYHGGALDGDGHIVEAKALFKADGFDRAGKLIDRHNLWDLVGASYKRALYPGMTDAVQVKFQCPSMARKRVRPADKEQPGQRTDSFSFDVPSNPPDGDVLHVTAVLWYRKANPEFLERVYGKDSGMKSPVTEMTRVSTTIAVKSNEQTKAE